MSLSFAKPELLWLLLPILLLPFARVWRDRAANRAVEQVVAPRLRERLVVGLRPGMSWFLFGLEVVALAFLVMALARPQYGFREKQSEGRGRSVMLAIDTSRSMLATDLAPDRFTRTRLAAEELVLALPNDRIGLIAFAGRAFVQAPLTIDHEAVLETLYQMDTETIPRGGTNIAEAIALAVESFKKSESANHALILFTDGDELEGDALAAAKSAAEENVMIISIGVGTTIPSLIPDRKSRSGIGFVTDESGAMVRTRLNDGKLEELARATQGLYLRLDSSEVTDALVKNALTNLDKSSISSDRRTREPIERYQWPLSAGVLCLLGSWVGALGLVRPAGRRIGVATATALMLATFGVAAGPARVGWGSDPYGALEAGHNKTAIEGFSALLERKPESSEAHEWRFGRGTAAFREGDYELAIEDFGQSLLSGDKELQGQSHYNLGNAIAKKASLREEEPELMIRDVGDAIEHFEAALALNPDNEDAKFNRDVLKEFLEQLKNHQEQTRNNQQPQESGGSGEQQSSGEGESEGEAQGEGEGGNQGNRSPEAGEGESDGQGQEQGDKGGGENKNDGDNGGERPSDSAEAGGDDGELEGKLEAVKGAGKSSEREKGRERGSRDQKKNPKTGMSPSEARQLLRALSDEDYSVRPSVDDAVPDGPYKDW